MSKTKTIDLTSGPILKTLAELALPIMASSLLGTAYNITDMAWSGFQSRCRGGRWGNVRLALTRARGTSANGRTGQCRTGLRTRRL